jgi:hypothetical protein
MMKNVAAFALLTVCCCAPLALADEPQATSDKQPSQKELFEKFKKTMDGATLIGQFTVQGDEDQKLRREEYTIQSVQKLDEGDFWLFKARIKYGETDRTIPMPLEVKWAGATPVITLDHVTLLNLGTFDARVLIHDGQYVGTWRHGDKGGQLFGVIEHREQHGEAEPNAVEKAK